MAEPIISVAFPVFNEQDNIQALYDAVVRALEPVGLSFELIFVDDGSTDRSLEIVKALRQRDPRVEYVSLSRSFGHQRALVAGLRHARGAAVITMDADLQHPPSVLPEMIRLWRDGYEVVYTHKRSNHVRGLRLLQIRFGYYLISKWSGLRLSFGQSDFRLLDRKVLDVILAIPESRKFLRGLVQWVGFRQIGMPYDPAPRFAGEAKYTFRSLAALATNGVLSFSMVPLRSALVIGSGVAAASLVFGAIALVLGLLRVAGADVWLPPSWTLLAAALTLLAGVQLMAIGMVGEYLGRVLEQTKGRPEFIVRESSLAGSDVSTPELGRPVHQ